MEPQVPRISLTIPAINAARHVVFLVTGESKRDAVRRVFGDTPDMSSPAAHVRPRGELTVYLDPARGALSDQFVGIDVGGTKIAVATLQAGELTEAELQHTQLGNQEALVEQLAATIESCADARHPRRRHRRPLADRVRHRPDPLERQHPAEGRAAARAAHRARRRARSTWRTTPRAPRWPRRSTTGRMAVPASRDVHRRHRRRRRAGAQRAALPRRHRHRVGGRPHDHRARPHRRRAAAQRRLPAGRLARAARLRHGARPPRRRGRPRGPELVPRQAADARRRRDGPRRRRRRARRRRGLGALPAHPRRAARDRDRQRDHHVRPARGRDRRRRLGGGRAPARSGPGDRVEVRRAGRGLAVARSGWPATDRVPACSGRR